MEEPVRMACPDCALVYRIKHPDPGRRYNCKRCGAGLRPLDSGEEDRVERREEAPGDFESRIARLNFEASSSAQRAIPDRSTSARRRAAEEADRGETPETRRRILERIEGLDQALKSLDARLAEEIPGLDRKAGQLLERLDENSLTALAEQVRETERLLLARLEEYREIQKREIIGLMDSPAAGTSTGHTVEIDIDDLAERLAAGVRARGPRLDAESGSAVDALARVADGLVREQSANSARLDSLAGEIKGAVASISGLDEWRGDLSHRVADEIGRSVEERVVGPISGALARQAPAILSELQDNKLVDIVSRSVREAQRPLLREILAGGRAGVPVWLFASVLLPLLLILGYLFLPGEFGSDDGGAGLATVAEGVARIESAGAPLAAADADRLKTVEEVVVDLHRQALDHVRNAATLEEQVKNLNARLQEKEALVNEYRETLQRQVRLLSTYRTRLTQLGVVPETIQE